MEQVSGSQGVDAVVVGAGVAGLSAALFLGRAGQSTLVYDGGPPRITAVEVVREYLGFDGRTPAEVLAQHRAEVRRYGVEIRPGQVERIEPCDDGRYDVHGPGGVVTARAVVLATGLVDELPPLAGVTEPWGRDLHVCPCFDGHEVRGQRFVVFGRPDRLAHMGAWVAMWSPHVTVVSPQPLGEADAERLRLLDVAVVADTVTGLVHDAARRLVAVTTAGGEEVACDAAWVALDARAASGLAASLCDADALGFAAADPGGRTSRPGVFAIGNAREPWAHLAHAAADGTRVGPLVTMYLLEARLAERRAARDAAARVGAV